MRVYTVHLPPLSNRDSDPVLIREGFNWAAFLFGPLWALADRLWIATFGMAVSVILVSALMDVLDLGLIVQAILSLVVAILFGAHGNDWHRRGLARRGFRETGVVAARNYEEALARYLDAAPHARASAPRVRATPVPPPPMPIAGL
jgi:hypothetical protein